jgi:PEP-CTERM motif
LQTKEELKNMKSKILTGLLAATAAFTSVLTANPANALNLKQSNPDLYNTFYGYVNAERNELKDASKYKLDAGSLKAIGNSFDVFFITEGATYYNDLYYTENGGDLNLLTENVASDDTSLAGFNNSLNSANGTKLDLGAGKTVQTQQGNVIDFFLKSFNYWKGDASNWNVQGLWGAEGAVIPNAGQYPNLKQDGLQHIVAYDYFDGTDNWILLGFEDLFGEKDPNNPESSDRDFNDAFFAVRGLTRSTPDPKPVPEPGATVALLGVAAAGFAGLRRRKAAK